MEKSYFSANLKSLRKHKKISLEELADFIGISKSAISDYENDKFSPALAICRKIATFFEVSVDSLEYSEVLEKISDREYALKQPESFRKDLVAVNEKWHLAAKQNETLILELKLQKQKVESLQIQLRLHDQLKDGKLSEIELLKTQIRLLEDKIGLGK